jgi:hypothetical protein
LAADDGRPVTFPRKLLTEGEDVVVDLRPHWSFLGWPLLATLATVALAIVLELTVTNLPNGVLYVLLAAIGLTALWLAGRMLRWVTTSLVLTTMRMVERTGVFARRAIEIRLDRINELSYHQSLPARLGRTGEVMVEMGGETGVIVFEHVPRPAAFQSLITEQMSALLDRGRGRAAPSPAGPPPPAVAPPDFLVEDTPPTGGPAVPAGAGGRASSGSAGPSVADRLTQLSELRRRGVVTEAEYEAKKAQLLELL